MYFLTAAGVTPGLTLMEPLNNAIMSMTAAVSVRSFFSPFFRYCSYSPRVAIDRTGQLCHRDSTDATMFQRRDHDPYDRSSINLRMCHGR